MSVAWALAFLSFEIAAPCLIIDHLKKTTDGLAVDQECAIICGFSFFIIISFIIFYFSIFTLWTQEYINKISMYSLSSIFLNVFNIVIIAKFKKHQGDFKKNFTRFRTFDLIISGLVVAMFFVLNWINGFFPQLPFFMTLTIQWLPLFFFAYMASFIQCFITFFICGLINFFMPNNYDTVFLAYVFDYLVPITMISVASLLKPYRITEEKNLSKKICQWFAFIIIPLLISYFSKVIAGVLYWFDAGWGWGKWSYSFVFNFFCFTSDALFFTLTVPVMCTTISFIKDKYY